jgi:MFS family permease
MPQVFFIRFFNFKDKVKPGMLKFGLIYRLMFLIISFVCSVILGELNVVYSVPLMLILIFTAAITGSSSALFWYDFFSRTTPMKLRGRLLAIRLFLGSALGIIGGSAVSVILSAIVYPHNFAFLFLICFILSMVSFYFLTRLIEPEVKPDAAKTPKQEQLSLREILSRSKSILRQDRNFRNFLAADALILMSMTAAAFYPVYGIKKFGLPTSYAGTFTIILMASQVIGNFFFGYLADYSGHKINVLILAACSGAATLTALAANNILLFGVVFFFAGCTLTLQGISRMAIVVEMCSEPDRPIYLGLLNSLTAPSILFGVIAGFLVTVTGYIPVFLIYILIAAVSFIWLYKKVREPRRI